MSGVARHNNSELLTSKRVLNCSRQEYPSSVVFNETEIIKCDWMDHLFFGEKLFSYI